MKVQVVTACHDANGAPDFALNEVKVSKTQFENGDHYDLVAEALLDAGYGRPFVHFDDRDLLKCPWLMENVKKYLRVGQE